MNIQYAYQSWLNSPMLTQTERDELAALAGDEEEIRSRFFGPLEFGTAGLRGTMGLGTYRMNLYVVRHVTQAFAQVIMEHGPQAVQRGVAICYDCRVNSQLFARAAACVMAANGISVRLFDALRPTPELSFAVREYGCTAGINITASHNPKEYNGYKVYWSDGAQLPPAQAARVSGKMAQIDIFRDVKLMDYDRALAAGLITLMGEETDEKFLSHVMAQAIDRQAVAQVADRFKMVYTPFHGTGHYLIPEALHRLGIKHVLCVPEQMELDGTFPTVASPNPENPEGFALAVELARKEGADFILGSDPDADRVGIMVRRGDGKFVPLTGNQTGVLMLDYLIGAMERSGRMPEKPVFLKTIVTTEMARKVAQTHGVACCDTFTGFKFISEKKNRLEAGGKGTVIFSFEESYGYMMGDFVRDKDAVTAALVLAEMAAWYAGQGMTLYDAMERLYETYGCYRERTMNLVMPGLEGMERMKALMASLRADPPAEIAGTPVAVYKDYASGAATDASTGAQTHMELSGSNVLAYQLADGVTILVRPSGTEPKIKVYILAQGETLAQCDERIGRYQDYWQAVGEKG
ncbi:MAG: phospho-sugar mutase [Oscillospiraceae bacterium]|nr:phospho-sugar mutase [Oscillospiraceae bacterium]